jgi:alkanesulfonate monooxygenase SsuD/methylene tetrahydromethanopterin reductase-like flavin-dependent oxidoreductase (luciferase family)
MDDTAEMHDMQEPHGTVIRQRQPPHPWVAAGRDKIRFGVGRIGPIDDWPAYLQLVRLAEELGFDSFLSYDHPTRGAECWASLAAVAAATSKIRLGTLPSCIYYRHPALVARLAADVDRISRGRFMLGLGVGDDPREFAALGLPFPGARDRLQAMEEAVQIINGVWGTQGAGGDEQPFTFHGAHFQVSGVRVAPGPLQQPHVPLLIAGGGERVTLRQVAQYGDACNIAAHAWGGGAFTADDVRRKHEVLRHHCEAAGRPYEAILRTYLDIPVVIGKTRAAAQAKLETIPPPVRAHFQTSTLAGTPDEAIAHFRALAAAGVQYFVVAVWGNDTETLRLLGRRVLPRVARVPREAGSRRGRRWFFGGPKHTERTKPASP